MPSPSKSLFLRAVAIAVALFAAPAAAAAAPCSRDTVSIVIDIGHAPLTPGATSARGQGEYAFNIRLGAQVEAQIRALGYRSVHRVAMPGADSLSARVARARALNADVLISIHHDSAQPRYLEPWAPDGRPRLYSDRFRGWSLFVSRRTGRPADSLRLATLIADRLLAQGLPFTTHHAEPIPGENRPFIDSTRGIYQYDGLVVLRGAPVAVLVEAGVIVNRNEEVLLASPERQRALAAAVAGGVDAFCAMAGAGR